ncbi:hypothetical protein M422DRAFT_153797 [Sphaerobolus stellatus SS14]|nr:hypothetical protein M422DRAFT_153797 [Sphaerobolus stellatus SS14]
MYIRSPYPPVPSYPPTNYHNVLFCTPEQKAIPDHVMFVDALSGFQRKRLEFIEWVYDAATALGADKTRGGLGLTSDNMVGIFADNCMEYMTIVHSLLAITVPFALFSSFATHREIKHYLHKSASTHMFVHADLLPKFVEAAQEEGFPMENVFVLEGGVPRDLNGRFKSLADLVNEVRRKQIPREPVRHAERDTLAYLVFSSGTSGLPKAVMISHGNLIFNLYQTVILVLEFEKVVPRTRDGEHPVWLGFLPIYHTYGLHALCLKVPLRPSTVVIMPRWNLDTALAAIPKYKVTHLPLIPSIIHTLLTSPKIKEADFSSIIQFGSGAAHLPPLLAERLQERVNNGILAEGESFSFNLCDIWSLRSLIKGYGMSEATYSLMHRPHPGLLGGTVEHIPSSVGILIPSVEALILRPDGTHCLPDEPGDLYVKCDNVALGYWNNPEATKEVFLPGGWLKTGDRFRVNKDGIFWFEDRAKDTLKVSGLQVSPAEIQDVLLDEPSGLVLDVAVAGVQLTGARTSDDNAPRAWIVLTEKGKKIGEDSARKVIDGWAKKSLSKYKWLRGGIEFIDEIPKNPTGKIMRRTLQDKYNADMATTKL